MGDLAAAASNRHHHHHRHRYSPPPRGGQPTVRGIASMRPFSRLGTPSCCRAIRARTPLSARELRLIAPPGRLA
ncbi:hypothetical protein BGW80DRAFT_1307508, partial [Lactifluus volemus]